MSDVFICLVPAFIVVATMVKADAYECALRYSKRRRERLERAAAKAEHLRILKYTARNGKND